MSVPGAENPDKVRNIVSGEGAREGMRGLYGGKMARLGVGYGVGSGERDGVEGVSDSASGPAPALASSKGGEKEGASKRCLEGMDVKGEGEGGEEVMLQVSINFLPQYPSASDSQENEWILGDVCGKEQDVKEANTS